MEYKNTVVFKEIEYLASLKAVSDILTVSLVDIKSSTSWIGTFTSKAIEKLSAKAGNQKSFAIFCRLLFTALQGKNPGLHLDFYSYQDLECIRKGNTLLSASLKPSKKKYLIISYITDFEKIHYPLPLIVSSSEQKYETSKLASDFSTENLELKQENAALQEKLRSFKEEFFSYKERTERRIEELVEKKEGLEEESKRMKEELDAIIVELGEETKKRKEQKKNRDSKALAREKEENSLLRFELDNYRKEIELLRKADESNKQLIDLLRDKLDHSDERNHESPPLPGESPVTSSLKYLNPDSNYSEIKPNLLSAFSMQLSQIQNLLKKNKS